MQLFIEKGHRKIGIIGGPEGFLQQRNVWKDIIQLLKNAGISIKNFPGISW